MTSRSVILAIKRSVLLTYCGTVSTRGGKLRQQAVKTGPFCFYTNLNFAITLRSHRSRRLLLESRVLSRYCRSQLAVHRVSNRPTPPSSWHPEDQPKQNKPKTRPKHRQRCWNYSRDRRTLIHFCVMVHSPAGDSRVFFSFFLPTRTTPFGIHTSYSPI